MSYDTLIVGGGIAGLYTAYKIKQRDPHHKLLLLEQAPRLGGRMGTVPFHGANIAIGAGVGRKRKDKYLQKLLKELNVPTHEHKHVVHYASTITPPCDVRTTFRTLKARMDEANTHPEPTFQEFATRILGKAGYDHFVTCAGYSDYEAEAAMNTLTYYGFNDNYDQWTLIGIPWEMVLDKIQAAIGPSHLRTNHTVTHIAPRRRRNNPDGWQVTVSTSPSRTAVHYTASRLILATTIDTVKRLVPGANRPQSPYQRIAGQPFLRIYGKFTPASAKIMAQYVTATKIVPGPAQKIIPIQPSEGIYMIVYADNQAARQLKKYTENVPEHRQALCNILKKALNIPRVMRLEMEDMRSFYWNIGTHYYRPNPTHHPISQNPLPHLFIVGELISHNQGWVEGALESVEQLGQL